MLCCMNEHISVYLLDLSETGFVTSLNLNNLHARRDCGEETLKNRFSGRKRDFCEKSREPTQPRAAAVGPPGNRLGTSVGTLDRLLGQEKPRPTPARILCRPGRVLRCPPISLYNQYVILVFSTSPRGVEGVPPLWSPVSSFRLQGYHPDVPNSWVRRNTGCPFDHIKTFPPFLLPDPYPVAHHEAPYLPQVMFVWPKINRLTLSYALLPSTVLIYVQMCNQSCRGISKRFGLAFGTFCSCLKDNINLVNFIGNSVNAKICDVQCAIRPENVEGFTCGE